MTNMEKAILGIVLITPTLITISAVYVLMPFYLRVLEGCYA